MQISNVLFEIVVPEVEAYLLEDNTTKMTVYVCGKTRWLTRKQFAQMSNSATLCEGNEGWGKNEGRCDQLDPSVKLVEHV